MPDISRMEWLLEMSQCVVRDLEKYGICVVDNFMGEERADLIQCSVLTMYDTGVFVEGETVGLKSNSVTSKNIRSDKITWVDGSENNCIDIAHLIATIDTIIMNLIRINRLTQSGHQTSIGGRTKVFVFLILKVYFNSPFLNFNRRWYLVIRVMVHIMSNMWTIQIEMADVLQQLIMSTKTGIQR